jgi:hypothetical protein
VVPATEPDNVTDDFSELNTYSTELNFGLNEPAETSKKRPMTEVNDDSEPKQAKQAKRRKTGAAADTLNKPKQKAPRRKKAEVIVGNQAESALVATSKPSTTMPAPRRKKADGPAPKQTNPSPSPISKPALKSVARPNIFPIPPLLPVSLGFKHLSPAISRDGEPALDKRSTSKEPTTASKKRQRHDARTSPNDGDGETHAKRARVSESPSLPSQRGASATQPSFHPTPAMGHPLPKTSEPVPTKETGQLMANVEPHVKPAPYEASRLQARRISDRPSHQTSNVGLRPPSRNSVWSVRQGPDTSESRPSRRNPNTGRERNMGLGSRPPPKRTSQFHPQDTHPAQRQQQPPQVSHPKESFKETAREPSLPRYQPSNNRRDSDASSQTATPVESGSSPPRIDPIPPWRMRQVKSSPGVPPRPSPMKCPHSQQGRNAFSSPSAAKPLRHTLPPPPDSLPPRPPVPIDFKNDANPTPSRRLSVASFQGVRGPEPHVVASAHQNTNGFPPHAAQVMSSPVGQVSQPAFLPSGWTQPQYQVHPSAHQSMAMAMGGPASAPGWPQNHGYVPPGWSPHGQASLPPVPLVPSNGLAVYHQAQQYRGPAMPHPQAQQQHGPMMQMQAQQSYPPVMQHQAPHSQTIVAPWSQNHQQPPGQAYGYAHGHPYGQAR